MKPPCETKIFDAAAPASSVSSDEDAQVYPEEEEYLLLKRSKTAWKPKFKMTTHNDILKTVVNEVKKKSWADMCDDEDSDDEDDESDVFARVTGFCLSNQGSTEGTEVGELPEAGETAHQQGGQPGAEDAAAATECPT